MYTSYSLDTYSAHDLNVSMRTSSGDVIEIGLSNQKQASFSYEQDNNGTTTAMSFASMQSFQFKIDSNGIDKQDKKEIQAFMKIAQPYIDSFMKELKDDTQKSPMNQIAQKIADLFEPQKHRDQNNKNYVKNNIVNMFDKSIKKHETLTTEDLIEKIFKDSRKLLEKTLDAFENNKNFLYA